MRKHNQNGITMVSWLIIIAFLGVVAVAALNIIPAYINFAQARSVLNDLPGDPSIRGKVPSEIKSMISLRFGSNTVDQISVAKNVKFKPIEGKSGFQINLTYEHRGRIIGNLDFIASFNHSVEIYP